MPSMDNFSSFPWPSDVLVACDCPSMLPRMSMARSCMTSLMCWYFSWETLAFSVAVVACARSSSKMAHFLHLLP